MNQRAKMLEMLARAGKQSREPAPEPTEPDFMEGVLDFAGNAAPIAGSVIGGGRGALATGGIGGVGVVPGATIGGGIGSLVGAGAHTGRDMMRRDREKMDTEAENRERQRLAKQRALLSLM